MDVDNDANPCVNNDANPAIALKPGITVDSARRRYARLRSKTSLAPDEDRELELLRAWLASVASASVASPETNTVESCGKCVADVEGPNHGSDLEYPGHAPMPKPVVSVDRGNVSLLVRGIYGLSLHPDLSLTDAKKRIAFLETLLVAGVDALELSLLREFVASASVEGDKECVASPAEPLVAADECVASPTAYAGTASTVVTLPDNLSVAEASKRFQDLTRKFVSHTPAQREEWRLLHDWLSVESAEPVDVSSPALTKDIVCKRVAFLESLPSWLWEEYVERSELGDWLRQNGASAMGVDVTSPAEPAYPTADELKAGLDPKGAIGATKTPLHLLPPVAMDAAAWVHALGAEKYGPYNWRHVNVCITTYVAAIMRHLNLYRDGIDLDDESGQSHLAHIVASCNILLDAAAAGTLVDDRFKATRCGEA